MTQIPGSYGDQLVAVLSAAAQMLADLPAEGFRLGGDELGTVLRVADRVGALIGAGRFTLTVEAETRGEVAASQCGSTRAWVAGRCPSLEAVEAGQVAKAVRVLQRPDLAPAATAVQAGTLSVPAGCVVAEEYRQLTPLVAPDAGPAVLDGLISMGASHGRAGVRAVRPGLLARYGLGQQLQDLADTAARARALSRGADIGGGISEYRLRLDAEGRAALEAAIGPLSAPQPAGAPEDATGHAVGDGQAAVGGSGWRDSRPFEQRRGDALVDVCRRAVTAGAEATPTGVKAAVFVTITAADLQNRSRAGTLFGGLDTGDWLGPDTTRKLACDSAVTPVLLDPGGQPLTLGRTRRLFTGGQAKALWLRDRHCTFPGCTVPAHWCDAHHLRHWSDGGTTDLDNGALLCGRHHTIAHRDRLTATLTPHGVTWNTTTGSYDRALARSDPGDDPDSD